MGGYSAGSPVINIIPTPPTPGSNAPLSVYNEILAVAINATETIITFTVPPATTAYLQQVDVSGDNIAVYTIFLNGQVIHKLRTYFGDSLNAALIISGSAGGIELSAGDVVEVEVNNFRPFVGNFNARIQYTTQ